MKHEVFAVRDHKAAAYMAPFQAPNVAVAVRMFTEAVRGSRDSMLSKFPEDYALFRLAMFDDETGLYVPEMVPALIVDAKAVVSPVGIPSNAKVDGAYIEKVGA